MNQIGGEVVSVKFLKRSASFGDVNQYDALTIEATGELLEKINDMESSVANTTKKEITYNTFYRKMTQTDKEKLRNSADKPK